MLGEGASRRGERPSEQELEPEGVTGEIRQRAPPPTPKGALSLRHTHTRLASARVRCARSASPAIHSPSNPAICLAFIMLSFSFRIRPHPVLDPGRFCSFGKDRVVWLGTR